MNRTKIGKYVDLELIGRGGIAEVYIGSDPSLERKVAIKLILPHISAEDDFEARFHQTAKTVAALRHANIVQIYEYSIKDGTAYIVMEYLEGGTLEELLTKYKSKGRAMSMQDTAGYLGKIAAGLGYAHSRGLVHRDINPSNILFSQHAEPIIVDFGIRKLLEDSVGLTRTGGVVGSPQYLSPEQASQQDIDRRSDMYSLGILLYEMVTGEVPFYGDMISVMMQHVNEPPKNPSQKNAAISEGTAQVILKALAKSPADRYYTVADMAQAFENSVMENTLAGKPSNDAATLLSVPKPGKQKTVAEPEVKPKSARSKKPNFLISALLIGAVIITAIGYLLFDNNKPAPLVAAAATPTQTLIATQTSDATGIPPATSTSLPPTDAPTPFPQPWVQITSITIADGHYLVSYETYGYTEALPGDHIHFFYDTVAPEHAGVPGSGTWYVWGGPRPFMKYSVASRPPAASQMCALFAYPDHSVELNTGNCLELHGG